MTRVMVQEEYQCPQCGLKYPIFRYAARRREKGHKKWLFCPTCGSDQNFDKVEEGGVK